MSQHVLAVDDEAGIRRLVQLNLQRAGYRVSTANDGIEGLAIVAEDRPDLIVLDVTMPHLDGFEMLRRLKAEEETAGIKVILLTARAQDADVHEGKRSGADMYLTKPFSPLQLIEAVREVFREPK
jgi:DNA-binding response OmpR family regulator